MSGTKQGGLKAAQKNLASNPNFYAEIGRKGGSATFESHGTCKGFAQDIECDCDLIEGPHFVKKCAGVAEPLFELANLEVVGNIHEDSELVEEK